MPDLSEFLLARIAEDEEAARAEVELVDRFFTDEFEISYQWARMTRLPRTGGAGSSFMPGCPTPARVLAECEAKRLIVDLHDDDGHHCIEDLGEGFRTSPVAGSMTVNGRTLAGCQTLRLLALPYADDPNFDESWRP